MSLHQENNPGSISIHDFQYDLPDERIALHPLKQRDDSKLLVYKNAQCIDDQFKNIAAHLPSNSLLVFNNSKVIHARLQFKKETGAKIEIFLLEPTANHPEYSTILTSTGNSQWNCFIGGLSKWTGATLNKSFFIQDVKITLTAKRISHENDKHIVSLSWIPEHYSLAEILDAAGDIPLPPYIKRTTDTEDESRYQTIYAEKEGSVAAPTAGLHFTEHIFDTLAAKNISRQMVTLHVGAGTFKPVKAATMKDHLMHAEWIDVDLECIQNFIKFSGKIIAVGTTSLRTIETLYWLGVKTWLNPQLNELELTQWEPYTEELTKPELAVITALQALSDWLIARQLTRIFTQTQLLIAPGYRFQIAHALVTNFHQPQSTLLLLVAAAIGTDWKRTYEHALQYDYRFLSYGDGNLIFIRNLQKSS